MTQSTHFRVVFGIIWTLLTLISLTWCSQGIFLEQRWSKYTINFRRNLVLVWTIHRVYYLYFVTQFFLLFEFWEGNRNSFWIHYLRHYTVYHLRPYFMSISWRGLCVDHNSLQDKMMNYYGKYHSSNDRKLFIIFLHTFIITMTF